ncbi:MAG: hypothetical protein H6534_00150 [Chthonomonadaceae bacterium]|nr:hypothetical protein [Chthonomonadaceae bacterium]
MMVAGIVLAFGTFSKPFATQYKIDKSSALGKAGCGVCHATAKGGKLNPYGLDLQKAMKVAKTKKLTPEVLKKIESLDSDKDGVKNLDEIKKDRNPGVK